MAHSTQDLVNSKVAAKAQLLRNTGANGGTAFLAAGGTFTGKAVAVSVEATATLTNVLSEDDSPIFAISAGSVVTRPTALTLPAGVTFARFTRLTSDVAAIIYLDAPLTPA